MDQRPKVLEILEGLPGDAADQALVAGLLEVAPEIQREIIRIILDRGGIPGGSIHKMHGTARNTTNARETDLVRDMTCASI